ncbi:hypothetical protein FKM82_029051 [Ascaphus truei]
MTIWIRPTSDRLHGSVAKWAGVAYQLEFLAHLKAAGRAQISPRSSPKAVIRCSVFGDERFWNAKRPGGLKWRLGPRTRAV